jgi:hypothetical protein
MTRGALWLMALVLATGVEAADDKARSREGSGSSGSSDVGSRHHASSSPERGPGRGSASRGGGPSESSRGSGDLSDAQRRHPRAGTGTGDRFGRYHYGGRSYGYGYRSFYHGGFGYYYPYYDSFYYGYPWYYSSGYYGYAPYYARRPYGYGYRDTGSLRVMVDPEKTKVYVDGYYAGIADDFDGLFQRLHISQGRHDITLKLEGYRTHRFRVYVPVDHTVKLRYNMVRGSGEDAEEVLGEPDMVGRPAGYARLEDEDRAWDGDDRRGPPRGDAGTLRLDVRPGDTSIYVDGAFRGTARDLDGVRLSPGRHHIEMVRPGYRTLERDVDVRPGETSELRADLERS